MRVVILSQQRTGSNMLRTMLAQQPGLRVGGEACNAACVDWWSDWTDEPMPDTLTEHTFPAKPIQHIEHLWKIFDIWNIHDGGTRYHKALLTDPTFKVIWLERENKIEQAMSLIVAQTTKHWVSYLDDDNVTDQRFSLSALEVQRFCNMFKSYREQLHELFESHNLPSLTVTYEELCGTPTPTLRRVTEFIDMPWTSCAPQTKPTFTTPLNELVTNYQEIVDFVSGWDDDYIGQNWN